MSWSQGLNVDSPAYEIAASESHNVRVIAGPGSGKSFAMKRRVARLLEARTDPKSILPVTFTRVAAEDLHRELVGMNVEGCDRLRATTLHSLALRILMRNHVLAATGRIPRPLNIFEMKPLEVDLGVHGGLREVRKKIRAYEAAWARLQCDDPGFEQSQEDIAFAHDLIEWLRFHEAMLIGEVIPKFYEYLRSNPAAQERTEYSHILVDEYQDLNKAEQSVIELLSDNADVCIVGDDDQSIYSFLNEMTAFIAKPEIPTEVEEVRIMSLHKSKGLSSPVTIIAGCIEGLLPMRPDSNLSPQSQAAFIEEQRRLFYVGVSRVKASLENGQPGTLLLTYSQRMPLATAMGSGINPAAVNYGTAILNASRFIAELGPDAPEPIAG